MNQRIAIVGALCLVVAGCGQDAASSPRAACSTISASPTFSKDVEIEPPPQVCGNDPIIVAQTATYWEHLVYLPGRLTYDAESRCLFMDFDKAEFEKPGGKAYIGGGRSLALWPYGTRPILKDGKRGVVHPVKGVLLEGDKVVAGSREKIKGNSRLQHVDLPQRCSSRTDTMARVGSDWKDRLSEPSPTHS